MRGAWGKLQMRGYTILPQKIDLSTPQEWVKYSLSLRYLPSNRNPSNCKDPKCSLLPSSPISWLLWVISFAPLFQAIWDPWYSWVLMPNTWPDSVCCSLSPASPLFLPKTERALQVPSSAHTQQFSLRSISSSGP